MVVLNRIVFVLSESPITSFNIILSSTINCVESVSVA